MHLVATNHPRCGGDRTPVEQGDVVVLFPHLANHIVHLALGVTKQRGGEQHHLGGPHGFHDLSEASFVVGLVSVVVGAEKHDDPIPTFGESSSQHLLTEINELARFCFHGHLPAEQRERVAHLIAVSAGRAGKDRIPDHQDP